MFAPHQRRDIIVSDVGIFLWLASLAVWTYYRGFSEVFRTYVIPYFWFVNPAFSRILPILMYFAGSITGWF